MKNFKRMLLITVTSMFVFLSAFVFSQTKWLKVESVPKKYEIAIDSKNQYEGKNVTTLKSVAIDSIGFGVLKQNSKPEKYLGKKVRMTGYLKAKDVADWAGFWVRVDQAGSHHSLSFDNMQERPIKGTADWKKYEIVLDVPDEASNIAFGALLNGTGQIWIANLKFEIVDNSVPTTGLYQQD